MTAEEFLQGVRFLGVRAPDWRSWCASLGSGGSDEDRQAAQKETLLAWFVDGWERLDLADMKAGVQRYVMRPIREKAVRMQDLLPEVLRDAQKARLDRLQRQDESERRCVWCGGSGVAVVYEYESWAGERRRKKGEPPDPFATTTVCCSCEEGRSRRRQWEAAASESRGRDVRVEDLDFRVHVFPHVLDCYGHPRDIDSHHYRCEPWRRMIMTRGEWEEHQEHIDARILTSGRGNLRSALEFALRDDRSRSQEVGESPGERRERVRAELLVDLENSEISSSERRNQEALAEVGLG